MRRTNPCWPECVGPGRSAECHATCPEWAKHEKKQFADYQARNELNERERDINEHMKATINRMKRGKRKHE